MRNRRKMRRLQAGTGGVVAQLPCMYCGKSDGELRMVVIHGTNAFWIHHTHFGKMIALLEEVANDTAERGHVVR